MDERVGFGAHKIELKWDATREDRIHRASAMLSRVLNLRSTVAFVGAGCSVPLGYPTWTQFAKLLVAHTIENCPSLPGNSKTSYSNRLLGFQQQLEAGPVRPNQIMYILG